MAGTDGTRSSWTGGPAVILVEPQMGENIGAAARAMFNFGLTDLRLVAPRDGWPNEAAFAMAAGAECVARAARVFDRLEDAIADLNFVVATTARPRDMEIRTFSPERAAETLFAKGGEGGTTGILFGGERSGLSNDHTVLADAVVTIEANPAFSSLNLGQAVLLLAYEYAKAAGRRVPSQVSSRGDAERATKEQLLGLFEHLEHSLVKSGFLGIEEKRPAMVRNLRAMLGRADLTDQEVRTLRGIIVSLERYNG